MQATPREVFVDTSYVIALFVARDPHHAAAQVLAGAMARARTQLVTTRAVLLEIGDALARPAYRHAGRTILHMLDVDPALRVLELTPDRYAEARALYDARPDQSWGLTDCVSFAVMRELRLTHALTADRHFEQAGYAALLRTAAA